jgi:hypothetical protein
MSLGSCLSSGCLYIEPTWQPNMEPEITSPPDYQRGDEVLVDLGTFTTLTVVANDEDSERVNCFWQLPNDADWTCGRAGTFVTSTVFLEFDPEQLSELDGTLIVAHIFDDLSAADVQVKFRLSFGGEQL